MGSFITTRVLTRKGFVAGQTLFRVNVFVCGLPSVVATLQRLAEISERLRRYVLQLKLIHYQFPEPFAVVNLPVKISVVSQRSLS